MSVLMQALTLVTCEGGKMILHEEVAKKVLESEEARNRPVAVISIAGMFRKGKSFFLNFVLRYLKAKSDPNWILCESGPLEGFDWMPNIEGVTSGITIWPQVFVVNEVAIVLIDTQGLFDISKSTAEDTYIMVLSFLFSSFQILNHHENLNSSDLKNFELFAKYGMALESKTKNVKGFQNLLFLVRDWKHQSRHSFGLEGGKQYLDVFLKTKMNEELRSVHETFSHCERVECFLMPHPGLDVAQNENFRGDINRIDDVFLDNMKTMVEHLIAKVKPKKMLSLEANGEKLLPVMKKYVEYINAREIPEPKSLLQLQIELYRKQVETKGLSIYDDRMRDGTRDNLLNKTKMDELHQKCVDAAIAGFDTLADFENKEQIETSKSEFLQVIKAKYMYCKATMEAKVESKLQNIFEMSKFSYYTELINVSRTPRNVANFCRDASRCREKAITDFKEKTNFGDTKRIKNLLETLKQLQMELLRKEVETKCLGIYNSRMRDGTNDNILNKTKMDELHKKCADAAIVEFNNLAGFENKEQFETSQSEFLQVIEAKCMHYKTTMEANVESELQSIFEIFKSSYKSALSDISRKSRFFGNLKKEVSKYIKKAIADFQEKTEFGDTERIENLLESLKQYMDETYKQCEADFLANHPFQRLFLSTVGVATSAGAASGLTVGTVVAVTAIVANTIGLATGGSLVLVVGAAVVSGGVVALSVFGSLVFFKKIVMQRRSITENNLQ